MKEPDTSQKFGQFVNNFKSFEFLKVSTLLFLDSFSSSASFENFESFLKF